jgi:hypothetical protein
VTVAGPRCRPGVSRFAWVDAKRLSFHRNAI